MVDVSLDKEVIVKLKFWKTTGSGLWMLSGFGFALAASTGFALLAVCALPLLFLQCSVVCYDGQLS